MSLNVKNQPEKRFFGAKYLNSRGGVFGKVSETSSMGNKTCSNLKMKQVKLSPFHPRYKHDLMYAN